MDVQHSWIWEEEYEGTIGGIMDIVYVGTGLLFFALCWGLLTLCERL
jgi:hypothetical protein